MTLHSRKVGVWIDHRRAVIVAIEGGSVAMETMESEVDKRIRTAGGARSATPYGPQDVAKEGRQDRRLALQLRSWYEAVLERIGDATSVFAFGPAQAPRELVAVIDASPRHRHTATELASSDKLTDPQVAARVRQHFGI